MTPDVVLAMIAGWMNGVFGADAAYDVARVPEGVILLAKGGNHVLIEAHSARLEVAS